MDTSFFKGKKILITGHTGFKGSWMCKVLELFGADITGYALAPPTDPSLFKICDISDHINSISGDIRDLENLQKVFDQTRPEIVIHMAAQPLVRESYKKPVDTYSINVMGTVNVLECSRKIDSVKSILNITTDKVYLNKEWEWGYRENEELNGYDPYSNSKSCSELVTACYKKSFFQGSGTAVSTMRAGNVIGGGDFAMERIIPDCVRATQSGETIKIRNPYAIRPYQHVLEPIMAYLMVTEAQYKDKYCEGEYNIGPDEASCWDTGSLVKAFCEKWRRRTGKLVEWCNESDGGPHEAKYLKLDCSRIKRRMKWQPCWNVDQAVEKVVEWTDLYFNKGDIELCMERQIKEYMQKLKSLNICD